MVLLFLFLVGVFIKKLFVLLLFIFFFGAIVILVWVRGFVFKMKLLLILDRLVGLFLMVVIVVMSFNLVFFKCKLFRWR